MSQIESFGVGSRLLLSGDGRRVARAISQSHALSTVRSSDVQDETDVTLDKIDAATAVTGHAMGAVVRVAQAQLQMEAMSPAASGRLAMLADNHSLVMADLQADHVRALRRK